MISLELAKRLKGLGLKWEPQEGDRIYKSKNEIATMCKGCGMFHYGTLETYLETWKNAYIMDKRYVWIPRLDQLLAEIEKRGYKWGLLYEGQISVSKGTNYKTFDANSPEEATAQALIWILEQKQATE